MNTTPDDVLFEDYLADRLSAGDVVRLKQVLSGDRSARARFVEVLQEWELLAESARQITGNSCPVMDDSSNSDGVKRRRPTLRVGAARPSPRRTLSMLVPFGALAATLLVALWLARPSTEVDPVGAIGSTTAGVNILRGKDSIVAKVGTPLLPGDHVRVGDGGQARIDYPDKTRLQLDQRTDVQLPADGSSAMGMGKRVTLVWGRVTADVTKQPAGRPMLFTTPNAQAMVLGTVLSLEFTSTASATRLDVTEGLVGITDSANRTMVEVPAGHFATVAENTQTVARPLVAATTAARKAYRSGLRATYFAGTDLKEMIFDRIETGIHTDLGLESVPLDQRRTDFSVRWNGYLQPLFSEKYLLTLRADASARLYIDDKLVIDAWGSERSAYNQGSVMLDASKRHALRVEYKQPKSGMMVKLDWASPHQQPEMIPVERLSTDQ
ncbi:MAG: FecR domain-containing protein [Planctomycetes bacterium]|nr:FecR domain-containing protein [Planctomycetota bacterium]